MIRFLLAFSLIVTAALPARAQMDIQVVTSPGGITAWLVEEPAFPFIAMRIAFKGGTALDTPDKQGATNLMMGLLEEGTGDLDAAGFKRAADELATQFSFDAGRDTVSVNARMLSANAPQALALLRRALVEPAFNQVAVERVRGQVLSSLKSDETDPHTIASQNMSRLAWGDHPYSRPNDGTVDTVTALSVDDITTAHRNALSQFQAVVGVVGDITAEELAPLLDSLLGDLPQRGKALPQDTEFQATPGTTVIDLDTPQSVAFWAQPGIKREHPDFIPAYVMMHILGGGGFGSRLTDEVREERGLTYGIYSFVSALDHGGYFGGSVSSANGSIAEALEVTRAEWARMAAEGVTKAELDEAKQYLTGSYPLRFDSNAKIARALVGLQLSDLGLDYVATRNDKVNALTVEDINRVARELLLPDALRIVVVGRPEGVQSTD